MQPDRSWVRGLADRSCQVLQEARAIVLTASNDHVLSKAAWFLRSLGVACRLRWKGARCTLRVGGLHALQRWQVEIGFLDPQKAQQLDEVLRDSARAEVQRTARHAAAVPARLPPQPRSRA